MKPATYKINGILLLDKPLEMTSNAALQVVKRLFAAKKAGHTGSLDPLATGMLPLCFGEATKFSQYLLDADKHYEVTAALGVRTTTADAEGEIIAREPVIGVTKERILAILQTFLGEIQQVPPMYSAIKIQGQPLYKLARRGIEIDRPARSVHIRDLQLQDVQAESFTMSVHCSKGTYIRTLVDDIGKVLGCGAHVSYLRRTAVVPYEAHPMVSLEALRQLFEERGLSGLHGLLLPMETAVQSLPALELSTSSAFYLRTGQAVMAPHETRLGLLRLYAKTGEFLGIGEMSDDGRVLPRRLLEQSA